MNFNSNAPHELIETFKKMDERLAEAKQDLEKMKSFTSFFDKALKNIEMLDEFYHSKTWIDGREQLFEQFPDQYFETAGEDSVWDVSQGFYYFKIKMMKILANDIFRSVSENDNIEGLAKD